MKEAVPQATSAFAGFQKFLTKSNAIALAIGVIIGAATGQLVNAIVNDIINPIIGVLLANVDLKSAQIVLGTTTGPDGTTLVNAIKYGDLISVIINYIIVMLVVYLIARVVAKDMAK